MFNKNTVIAPASKTIKISFNDFDKNPEPSKNAHLKESDTPKVSYNFSVVNGMLEDGYGFRDLMLPYRENDRTEHKIDTRGYDILSVWDFRWFDYQTRNNDTFIFFMDSSFNPHYFYEYSYQGILFSTDMVFTSMPTIFEYRVEDYNMLICSSPTDDLNLYAGGSRLFTYSDAPKMLSCCVHENSFYAISTDDSSKLIYTDSLNAFDWAGSNFQEYLFTGGEGGRLRKLFSFNDYVYLFRDTGIVKIYPFSNDNPLSITHIYYSSSFIFPETIQRCGEYIIFITREGLHLFDGNSVEKVNLEIFDLVDTSLYETFCSASQRGKYYLACKINFNDGQTVGCEASSLGYKNNAILIYDVESGSIEIMRGVDVSDFAPIESNIVSKLVCTFNNDNIKHLGELTLDGEVFGELLPKKWTSVETNFGYAENMKVIKSFSLFAKKDCQVEIKSDVETKVINIKGKDNFQKIKTLVKGKYFEISFISTEKGQKISSPEFEVEVLL